MNATEVETELSGIDLPFLRGLVREAVGRDDAVLLDWRYEPIKTGMGPATVGVYRLSGTARSGGRRCARRGEELDGPRDDGEEVSWSLILKALAPPAADATGAAPAVDMGHPLYWRREADAYRSGLLDDLPGLLRPPRCYALVERARGSCLLWLEDAGRNALRRWPEEAYRAAAYALGSFNAAYLAGTRPMPGYPWLTRDGSPRGVLNAYAWLRDLAAGDAIWSHPLVAAAFPQPAAERLVRLWDGREALLEIVERMPDTLCHHDAWRGNIFIPAADSADPRLVLIDWAFVGRGPLGADAGDLLGAGYGLVDRPASGLRARAGVIFEGYEAGLREAGWESDVTAVRRAIAAFAAAKYGCLQLWLTAVRDESQRSRWEEFSGLPFEAYLPRQAAALYDLLDLADDAMAR